jgi:hypothetical protein
VGGRNIPGYLQYPIYHLRGDGEKCFSRRRGNGPLGGKVVRLEFQGKFWEMLLSLDQVLENIGHV